MSQATDTTNTTTANPLGQQLKDDNLSLEDKLKMIEEAMKNAQDQANEEAKTSGKTAAPVDPADLTMCEGCQ